ncbi:hypothetical protein RSal33209_2797 [Renibacterium salmoninarum ATCC 33209]|uniref:Uncharacterized protein n=1 Tax=Renibacterium salmoninarum (strain ATCC 33209 / DSM 20767 / JCM 11484 / NBRC 15589 / NCIMB 2235) TaxID=288705 RepID=A9WTK1_RENSM|nr:hypothetical protein RSal33209_2797 [Renibacterium salmoninarum ATCC 33209]
MAPRGTGEGVRVATGPYSWSIILTRQRLSPVSS